MVGVVIVSHSQPLAESIVDYTKLMAGEAKAVAAGGLDDGGFGTSFQKIYEAIDDFLNLTLARADAWAVS